MSDHPGTHIDQPGFIQRRLPRIGRRARAQVVVSSRGFPLICIHHRATPPTFSRRTLAANAAGVNDGTVQKRRSAGCRLVFSHVFLDILLHDMLLLRFFAWITSGSALWRLGHFRRTSPLPWIYT